MKRPISHGWWIWSKDEFGEKEIVRVSRNWVGNLVFTRIGKANTMLVIRECEPVGFWHEAVEIEKKTDPAS